MAILSATDFIQNFISHLSSIKTDYIFKKTAKLFNLQKSYDRTIVMKTDCFLRRRHFS